MPAARLMKHRRKSICEKAVEMWIRQRCVKMVGRCEDMELILYDIEWDTLVELVANFKYLGRPLDQTDNDLPAV